MRFACCADEVLQDAPRPKRAAAAAAAAAIARQAAAGQKVRRLSATADVGAADAGGPVLCPVCLDRVPEAATVSASSDEATTSTRAAGCGHKYCRDCMTQYVRTAIKDRKYPLVCPTPGCETAITRDGVSDLLQEHTIELQVRAMTAGQIAVP